MNSEQQVDITFELPVSRRNFITAAVAGLAATAVSASPLGSLAYAPSKIKAIAFDAFPIFDPRPVFAMVSQMFPDKGAELSEIWRTKQFEYSWLRTAGAVYKDFWRVTEEALNFAARKVEVNLTSKGKKQLMEQYLMLNVWPDVIPALQTLRQNGIRLVFLSNMTSQMLKSSSINAKIDGYFEHVISTDRARTYKPSPAAYQLGVDTLQLKKDEILFAAFAGWDASGAKWFGYPTFWVNRLGAPAEELDALPDGVGRGMDELVAFLRK